MRPAATEPRIRREPREPRDNEAHLLFGDAASEHPVTEHGGGRDRLVARERQEHRHVASQVLGLGPRGHVHAPARLRELAVEPGGVLARLRRPLEVSLGLPDPDRGLASVMVGCGARGHLLALLLGEDLEQEGILSGVPSPAREHHRLGRLVRDRHADVEAARDPADRGVPRPEQRQHRLSVDEGLPLLEPDPRDLSGAPDASDCEREVAREGDRLLALEAHLGAGVAVPTPYCASGEKDGLDGTRRRQDRHAREERALVPVEMPGWRDGERRAGDDGAREEIVVHGSLPAGSDRIIIPHPQARPCPIPRV